MARFMVVEDESMILALIEDVLTAAGHQVTTARRLSEAEVFADQLPLDGAILDVNVIGGKIWSVAEKLAARGIPYMFVTGFYPEQVDMPAPLRKSRMLMKPVRMADLVNAAQSLCTMNDNNHKATA